MAEQAGQLAGDGEETSRMRITVVTPTARSSAIGAVSSCLTQNLARNGYEVTVVQAETLPPPVENEHQFPMAPVHYAAVGVEKLLQQADVVIYQVGNHYPNHAGAVYWLYRIPGVVCLHDAFLGHLFAGWAEANWTDAQAVLRRWYGPIVEQKYWDWQAQETFIESTINVAPMTEWICARAIGIFTHSSYFSERIIHACPGPVWSFPLCHAKEPVISASTPEEHRVKANDRFTVITFGHIIPNKCVNRAIEAIGTHPELRDVVDYRVVGRISPDYGLALKRQARNLRVSLAITGEVSDERLAAELAGADVVLALRWPATELASASVIEALWHGKPTVVTDTGCYAELPDNIVHKSSPEISAEQLGIIIHKILSVSNINNQSELRSQYSRLQFDGHIYANRVSEFIKLNYTTFLFMFEITRLKTIVYAWKTNIHTNDIITKWRIFQ